ncbi:bifunctional diguanylate cyclase/phosphodiesterase [Phaeobacter sp. B1627]|uniref:putative bifunctional diguanylate cyclase/phosphodiesterase n=1 Tax=Phaeobacter sp. B1627 TaxID=2583809 RepID=UPI001117B99B|nr:GGDEF domain-containing phosphodiesterase [Phaeobacter sp. B1627]TNJ41242.1 EAL domain-containing protein [Phaeobacter sp. B1627]
MQTEFKVRSAAVARRFWVLTALILVLTLLSSLLAIRYVALPFFKNYQYSAIQAQAEESSAHLNALLSHNQVLMSVLANDPVLINIALGFDENPDYVPDVLQSLRMTQNLSWVTFYDAFHEALSNYDVRPDERDYFSPAALSDLLTEGEREATPLRQPILLHTRGTEVYLVLATPVLHLGYIEGMLLSGYRLNTEEIFPANEIVKRTYLVQPTSDLLKRSSSEVRSLADFNVSVALVPDHIAVQTAGRAVMTNAMIAISVVLFGTFGIFAIASRAVIIEPHRALEAKQAELSELAAIAQRANDAIIITDLDSKIVWTNPSFEVLTGHVLEDIRGMDPSQFLQGPDTALETRAKIRDALKKRQAVQVEILNYRQDGTSYWVSLSISPLRTDKGRHYGYMAISNDVTEARAQREAIIAAKHEIEYQAMHDPLTGLQNRRELDRALALRAEVPDQSMTIVRLDLDHFKNVNDTMGHDAGDFLLCEVARILQTETRATDLAARVGGDEFIVLLDAGATSADGEKLALRMLDRIGTPVMFDNKPIRVGASFGVASTGDGLLTFDQLSIGADAALYEAKASGRNCARLYTPELHLQVLNHRTLARELRHAVTREEFEPYFQPQFDAVTHEIVGVETLARWHSPDLGLQMPTQFLPVAEQLSLIEDIDNQIFAKALRQIDSLQPLGIKIPKVSVNVTVDRIGNDDVYEQIKTHHLDGPTIVFEILESVLVEEQNDLFHFGLDRLRDAGVQIEIDDFGSGHASVVGLMQLRPDAMKIDQRLIRPITVDPLAHEMLTHVIGMAQLLNLRIIAEGVESMQHARMLRDIGCHTLQGYAFCKPLPLDELRAFILQHEARLSLRALSS